MSSISDMHHPSAATLNALVMKAKQARVQGQRVEIEGQSCVIKWAQPKPWARVRSWLAALVCWLAFGERIAPSALRSAGIQTEAQRLRALFDAGLRVPRILLQQEDCLVLDAVGVSLDRVVGDLATADKIALFARVTDDLADWHARGYWHGGAQLRNVTLHQDQIYRIDFEERHGDVLSVAATRVYDLLLWFGDAFTHLSSEHLMLEGRVLVQRYFDRVQDTQVQTQEPVRQCLRRLLRVLQALVWMDRYCPSLTRSRDKQRVVRFARVMRLVLSEG